MHHLLDSERRRESSPRGDESRIRALTYPGLHTLCFCAFVPALRPSVCVLVPTSALTEKSHKPLRNVLASCPCFINQTGSDYYQTLGNSTTTPWTIHQRQRSLINRSAITDTNPHSSSIVIHHRILTIILPIVTVLLAILISNLRTTVCFTIYPHIATSDNHRVLRPATLLHIVSHPNNNPSYNSTSAKENVSRTCSNFRWHWE